MCSTQADIFSLSDTLVRTVGTLNSERGHTHAAPKCLLVFYPI